MEEAFAFQSMKEEFHLTDEEIAKVVGKSRPVITNSLRLITLPKDIQSLLLTNKITMGHARALITVEDENQKEIAEKVIANNLSVRQTEKIIRMLANPEPKIEDDLISKYENDVSELTLGINEAGYKGKAKALKNGKIRLTIELNNLNDFKVFSKVLKQS